MHCNQNDKIERSVKQQQQCNIKIRLEQFTFYNNKHQYKKNKMYNTLHCTQICQHILKYFAPINNIIPVVCLHFFLKDSIF